MNDMDVAYAAARDSLFLALIIGDLQVAPADPATGIAGWMARRPEQHPWWRIWSPGPLAPGIAQ
jgi:hypothetical protein